MTDPKKLAEEAKWLADKMMRDSWAAVHADAWKPAAADLHAAIDQLSALVEKAERLEVALKAIIQADDAQELEQADIERGRAALSTGEPK
jgi:hypothetical protein